MLNLSVEIHGKTYDDLAFALEVVLERVREEYTTGHASNESGRYLFSVTGEEESREEEEEEGPPYLEVFSVTWGSEVIALLKEHSTDTGVLRSYDTKGPEGINPDGLVGWYQNEAGTYLCFYAEERDRVWNEYNALLR